MSRGRHARPRPPRSDTPLALLVVVLAAGVMALALMANDFKMLRWAIAGTALLLVLTIGVIRTSGRETVRVLELELTKSREEVRSLWLEVTLLREAQREMFVEVAGLRAHVANYVVPVPNPPEAVYPSLHVPLVRAAFAEEHLPDVATPDRFVAVDDASVSVSGNGVADPEAPRQLLDLTASEIAELRHAN